MRRSMQKDALQRMEEVGSDSPKTSEVCQVSKLESGARKRKRGSGPGRPGPARFAGLMRLAGFWVSRHKLAVGFAHRTRKFVRSLACRGRSIEGTRPRPGPGSRAFGFRVEGFRLLDVCRCRLCTEHGRLRWQHDHQAVSLFGWRQRGSGLL